MHEVLPSNVLTGLRTDSPISRHIKQPTDLGPFESSKDPDRNTVLRDRQLELLPMDSIVWSLRRLLFCFFPLPREEATDRQIFGNNIPVRRD
jgi:hypothetical protein